MSVYPMFFFFSPHVFFLSSRSTHIRPLPVFKPAGSPTVNRDAELYAPYRTPPRAASSTNSSSCNSSPTSRCQTRLSCHALLIITEQRLCFLKLREACDLLVMSNLSTFLHLDLLQIQPSLLGGEARRFWRLARFGLWLRQCAA